jgi:polyvinyl alcohol dehydrogenase (cytochrome)
MSQESILRALESGKMQAQGSLLTPEEREAVSKFLGKPGGTPLAKAVSGFCSPPTPWVKNAPEWNGWSIDAGNSRYQSGEAAGLTREDVPRLKVKWAFGFPNSSNINSQPTTVGGQVFVGTEDGTVYSLNAQTGCINWTFKALATVRTAPIIDPDSHLALFGDLNGNVYGADAASGRPVWQTRIDLHAGAKIVGSLLLVEGRLFVAAAGNEEGWAADPHYPCCTFRGTLVALEARTGRQIWKVFTIPEEAHRTGVNSIGTPTWGPSGGGVWSRATADLKRRAVYVATGNSYSDPPSPYSDAVIAFDIDTGKRLWFKQLFPPDRWNGACASKDNQNCPTDPGPDYDFGSPPILRSVKGGPDLLIVGQKSGVVHAIDPDRNGEIVWQTRIAQGGPLGGIQFGGGADRDVVYFPRSDWQEGKAEAGGGLFALSIPTGKIIWHTPPPKPPCVSIPGCSASVMSPVTVLPGVVFSASNDGHLRAYDSQSGVIIWDFDSLQDFKTVDGIDARGGAFTSIGPSVAAGMLFIEAGYGGLRGNVLLAFSVDGK